MSFAASPSALNYTQIRLLWCGDALAQGLRRWGVYIIGTLAMAGGLASSVERAWAAMKGLAGLAVLPLFQATQQPWPVGLLTMALHSLGGAVVVWALRPILWSRAWAEAEQALPLTHRARALSDLLVVAIGLSPLVAAYALGAGVCLALPKRALTVSPASALAWLAGSIALSIIWGMAALALMRHPPRWPRRASPARVTGAGRRSGLPTLSPWQALVWQPLRNGPARRTGHLWLSGSAALLALVAVVPLWPTQARWWLAGLATLGLVLTSRLHLVVTQDLAPLHHACLALPCPPERLRRWRQALAMLPIMLSHVLLVGVVLLGGIRARPWVLAAFVATSLAGGLTQVLPTAPPTANGRLGAWWLTLASLVALASETPA